jgi:hypothetical protein
MRVNLISNLRPNTGLAQDIKILYGLIYAVGVVLYKQFKVSYSQLKKDKEITDWNKNHA